MKYRVKIAATILFDVEGPDNATNEQIEALANEAYNKSCNEVRGFDLSGLTGGIAYGIADRSGKALNTSSNSRLLGGLKNGKTNSKPKAS